MNKSILTLLSITTILAGCTSSSSYAPTEQELNAQYFGEYPKDYEKILKNDIIETLIDPESVRFTDMSKPYKSYLSWASDTAFGFNKYYGWLVCVDVNAKNRMGGYTGKVTHVALIKDNKVYKIQEGLDRDIAFASDHRVQCKY